MSVFTGLDRVALGDRDAVRFVEGRRIGLVAHPASVDRRLRHVTHVLREAGAELVALFGPEHGFAGQAQDMIHVEGEERREGPVVRSLYGATYEELSPRPEWLEGLDAVVVDLQDVGSRYYTFVWTTALVLEVAAKVGVPVVVLDRPNPLDGVHVEGAPQRPGYRSFVGLFDVAVRHGMTIGEIATMVRSLRALPEESLYVVRMQGWERSMRFEETGLPWVLPSPNMPTCDTARVYPGGCLVEGTTLSEGRGTTRPFELWGAPGIDGERLARSVPIEGAVLRPVVFQPTFHKHAGKPCGGVQVHVTDVELFRPYEAYLRLLAAALEQRPDEPKWRTETYEYVTDRLAIDLLTGGPEYREAVESGQGLEDVIEAERQGEERFRRDREPFLLYRA
ncbi:MAG: DUF1343 domain-containing protein [Polyangiales bacterium]